MTGKHSERADDVGRRVLALVAALLWVLGFELLPDLHLGHHAELGAHSHGQVAAARHDEHAHGHHHGTHHHGAPSEHLYAGHEFVPTAGGSAAIHSSREDARDGAVASRLDLEHGRHDLLHRGIAVMQPPVAMPTVADAAIRELSQLRGAVERARSRAPLHARARGPPAAATCRSVDCTA